MLKRYYKIFNEVGTDEAGRGCLAGPVTAAAIILPKGFKKHVLNDSKLLSENKRIYLKPIIEKINILNASILAMHLAIDKLNDIPKFIIVDGNRFKTYNDIPYECIIKGDSKYMSIAAASVLAKTYRDAYMEELHEEYPMYNWKRNKGYPTKEHRAAIRKYGITKYHRKSFRQLPEQLTLKL